MTKWYVMQHRVKVRHISSFSEVETDGWVCAVSFSVFELDFCPLTLHILIPANGISEVLNGGG